MHADDRVPPAPCPRPRDQPPAGWGGDGEQVHQSPEDGAPDPIAKAPRHAGNLAGVAASEPDGVPRGKVQRDLGARVTGPDDEHGAVAQLVGVAIGDRVQLDDGGTSRSAYAGIRGVLYGLVATTTWSAADAGYQH